MAIGLGKRAWILLDFAGERPALGTLRPRWAAQPDLRKSNSYSLILADVRV